MIWGYRFGGKTHYFWKLPYQERGILSLGKVHVNHHIFFHISRSKELGTRRHGDLLKVGKHNKPMVWWFDWNASPQVWLYMHVLVFLRISRVPSSQAKLVINSNPLGQMKFESKFVMSAWPDGLGHETIWDRSYKPWKKTWFFRVYRGWNTTHLYGDYFINHDKGLLHQSDLCFHVE